MKMQIIVFGTVLLILVFSQKMWAQANVTFSFCQPDVSSERMQSNLSFVEGFSFRLDRNGRAVDVARLAGKFVSEEAVRGCLDKWHFAGFDENAKFSMYLSWKHGVGWTEMIIKGKAFYHSLKRIAENCESAP